MRTRILRIAAALTCLSLALPVAGQPLPRVPRDDREAPIRPNPRLTPGATATSDPAVFCQAGYSRSVRHTSGRVKREVYRAYGMDRRSGRFEIDHLVPLGLGGSDTPENLWPQSFGSEPWNAEVKDRLEWRLKRLVCNGATPARQAQQDVATDWIAAYGKYCPSAGDCPAYRATYRAVE